MEVLKYKLWQIQQELEDAFKLEIDYEEVKETKDGKRLLNFLRKRRRAVSGVIKVLEKI